MYAILVLGPNDDGKGARKSLGFPLQKETAFNEINLRVGVHITAVLRIEQFIII